MKKETKEEIKELEDLLSKSEYKPIESPVTKLGRWKFLKDKEGNKLSVGEYFKRWGQGIANLTPVQKITNESRATLITLIGSLVCLIALIIFRDKLIVSWFAYGLILVFVGNSWNTGIKWISLKQQLKFFKEAQSKSVEINDILDKLDSGELKDE